MEGTRLVFSFILREEDLRHVFWQLWETRALGPSTVPLENLYFLKSMKFGGEVRSSDVRLSVITVFSKKILPPWFRVKRVLRVCHFPAGKNKKCYIYSIRIDEMSKTVEEIFEKYSFLKFLERFFWNFSVIFAIVVKQHVQGVEIALSSLHFRKAYLIPYPKIPYLT